MNEILDATKESFINKVESEEESQQEIEATLKSLDPIGQVQINFWPQIVAIPNDWEKMWSLEERDKLSAQDRIAYEEELLKIMHITFE